MVRHLARTILTLLMISSLGLSGLSLWHISENPALRAVIDRSVAEIAAASEAGMARYATPALVASRLEAHLAIKERNWLAIDAVLAEADARGIVVPPEVMARIDAARSEDFALLARAQDCIACAIDPGLCDLSAVLICQTPMALTPLGDLAGIALEATHYMTGSEVDRLNLALSLVGLAATGMIVASGGSSASIKLGATVLRLARRMNLLSDGGTRLLRRAVDEGIDWAKVAGARKVDDLQAALNPRVLAPLGAMLADTGRMAGRLDPTATLHLVRYIDGPDDARRLADAVEALGPRAVGRLEILGKSRFMRATLRYSDTAWQLFSGIAGFILGLAALLSSLMQSLVLRGLRRSSKSQIALRPDG